MIALRKLTPVLDALHCPTATVRQWFAILEVKIQVQVPVARLTARMLLEMSTA